MFVVALDSASKPFLIGNGIVGVLDPRALEAEVVADGLHLGPVGGRIVGEVLGRVHPHGDTSVYDTLVLNPVSVP